MAHSRLTVGATISDEVLEDFTSPSQPRIYVSRNPKNFIGGNCFYSYPLDKYIGIVSYDDTTLSLFFERTDGLIDEARVSVKKGNHKVAIRAINKAFRFAKNIDIFFGRENSEVNSNVVYGTKKVISTVSINRN